MKVKTLKADFKKTFGATLRVYTTTNCKQFADDDATLASLRANDCKGGELSVAGQMHVGAFEQKVADAFGIGVQVANSDDTKLCKDDATLASVASETGSTPVISQNNATTETKKVELHLSLRGLQWFSGFHVEEFASDDLYNQDPNCLDDDVEEHFGCFEGKFAVRFFLDSNQYLEAVVDGETVYDNKFTVRPWEPTQKDIEALDYRFFEDQAMRDEVLKELDECRKYPDFSDMDPENPREVADKYYSFLGMLGVFGEYQADPDAMAIDDHCYHPVELEANINYRGEMVYEFEIPANEEFDPKKLFFVESDIDCFASPFGEFVFNASCVIYDNKVVSGWLGDTIGSQYWSYIKAEGNGGHLKICTVQDEDGEELFPWEI